MGGAGHGSPRLPSLEGRGRGWVGPWLGSGLPACRPTPNPSLSGRGVTDDRARTEGPPGATVRSGGTLRLRIGVFRGRGCGGAECVLRYGDARRWDGGRRARIAMPPLPGRGGRGWVGPWLGSGFSACRPTPTPSLSGRGVTDDRSRTEGPPGATVRSRCTLRSRIGVFRGRGCGGAERLRRRWAGGAGHGSPSLPSLEGRGRGWVGPWLGLFSPHADPPPDPSLSGRGVTDDRSRTKGPSAYGWALGFPHTDPPPTPPFQGGVTDDRFRTKAPTRAMSS
ncbi:hypothetical protein ABIC16_002351 [Sphingomonas sp. PvP055]